MSKAVLGYWNVRGVAECIRYLCAYTKTEYEIEEYNTGEGPEYNKDCWLTVKENLGLPFPNLPYYKDGKIKMTQTLAIMRYIAKQHDLCGKTEEEMVQCDMVSLEAMDFIMGFIKATYFCKNYEEDIKIYLKNIRANIRKYANHLGQRPYMAGENLTFADFIFWEAMDQVHTLDSTVFDGHDNLKGYMKKVADLPRVKEYLSSDLVKGRPISNKMAKWGVKPIPRPDF